MNNHSLRQRLILLCAVAGVSVSPMLAGNSFGQTKKTPPKVAPKTATKKPATPAPAVEEDTTPAPAVKGLNGLGDDALLGELSSRGLETLLVTAFDANKIPEAQRSGFRALRGLRQLTEPAAKKLTPGKRQELITQIVSGLKTVLPQINDPRKLMEASGILLSEGSDRDVNLLEYWGETAATQARLKVVVDSATSMLDKAVKAAGSEQAGIEKRMKSANDKKLADDWTNLEDLKTQGAYTRNMAAYYASLATPRVPDMSAREKIVNDAMEALKEYDADDTGFQTIVKLRMGKMLMTKGAYAEAKTALAEVSTMKTKPAPVPAQVDQAKYFSVVCDLQSGDVATANKELGALIEWEQANLPKEEQKGPAAAAELLRYRIALAEAELSQGDDKAKFEKTAQDILLKLSVDRPDLSSIIYEQLVERVGTQPVKGMNALLLRALMRKAESEMALDKPAPAVMERGAEAAREIVARSATDKSLDAKLVEAASYYVASFQEAAGKKVEAGNAYVDFVTKYPKSESALGAFNAAGRIIIVDLRHSDRKGDADVVAAFDRFLPIAVKPPFNRKEYSFDYAQRLRQAKPPMLKEAAASYAEVPVKDSRYELAKYLQMISLTDLLDQRLPTKKPVVAGKDREALVAQILQLGDEVKKVSSDAAAKATDDKAKDRARLHLAGATLTAAQIAADEQKDSKKVIQILATFEKDTTGLPGVADMMNDVLFRRVKAYMDAGQDTEATNTLLALLNKTGGQEGATIVLGLLQKLNDNYKKAEGSGDAAGMAQIAKNRALLSGRLVDWATKSTSPDVQKFVYSYSVFDAESKLLAGRLNKDQAMVKNAKAAFEKLNEPKMVDLYKKEIASNPKALEDFKSFPHHRNVMLGLGLTQFELGDFKGAQASLSPLVQLRKLGTDRIEKTDVKTGETTIVDNEQFWETWYKFLRSNVELYKADRTAKDADTIYEQSKTGLKRLYILNRKPGGELWAADFEKLRTEIIPEFDPASIPVAAPTSGPATTQATQPVAER